MYDKTNFATLISNSVRVYKGGSWRDVAYWLAPGTRRYLEEDSSTSTIGFRCAMIRAGENK
jgi:formylglycine-generating enzyme required for sulfatase activity